MNLRREKKIASLEGTIVEGEHMVFPHLRETFYLVKMQYDDIKPSGTTILKDFEKLSVKTIEGTKVKGENVRAMVHPMSLETSPRNCTAIDIPIVFLFS